ncbi:30S ribosomal protein S7 [Candidatus Woesearchaeota archaeon]|nr:30S ribosomal protein S7 [Candidatus Woesearchaeota archaeon]
MASAIASASADIKVFNRWSTQGIQVEDPGLKEYICLQPRYVPKTGARYAGARFHKSNVFIVERFLNRLMNAGHKAKKHFKTSYHMTGKSHNACKIVEELFEKIEQRIKKNPIEVLVKAIENGAPREEIITIEYGGARYPKAVECSPQRRVDWSIRMMVQGSFHKSFNSKKKMVDCLLDEVLAAYQGTAASNVISRKFDMERQSDSSR